MMASTGLKKGGLDQPIKSLESLALEEVLPFLSENLLVLSVGS